MLRWTLESRLWRPNVEGTGWGSCPMASLQFLLQQSLIRMDVYKPVISESTWIYGKRGEVTVCDLFYNATSTTRLYTVEWSVVNRLRPSNLNVLIRNQSCPAWSCSPDRNVGLRYRTHSARAGHKLHSAKCWNHSCMGTGVISHPVMRTRRSNSVMH
jgi:hypothetical protein